MTMDILKRKLAPLLPDAWTAIDEEARRVLKLNLTGRKLVDFQGPHGWRFAAVNTGRLAPFQDQHIEGVSAALRVVQPLVEVRTPIKLAMAEMDAFVRGATNPDLSPVVQAAERIARLEDSAIFNGLTSAAINGIIPSTPHRGQLPSDLTQLPRALLDAKETLRRAGVGGPYALALSAEAYEQVYAAAEDGYPIAKRLERQIVDGPILRAPAIAGAVLLSTRGNDYELTVGQDLSIMYVYHQRDEIELALVESFTFRVLEPAAAVYLAPA